MSHDTDKLIRQLSLVAFLMAERRPLTARDVKSNVEGYSEMSDEAFARRFYSDRAELVALGVPLQSQRDEFTGEELYTLRSEQYFLPQLVLSDEELAALFTALSLLDGNFAYAEPLRLGLQNLALGRPGFPETPSPTAASVLVRDPDYSQEMPGRLGKLESAISKQRTIKFQYRSISTGSEGERTLNPYALLRDGTGWYVVGHDLDRKDMRTFRVSRIRSDIRFATRRERDYRIPADFNIEDFRGRAVWQLGDIRGEAALEVKDDTAWWVARTFGDSGRLEDGIFRTEYSSLGQLASWILRQDGRAVPLEPDGLRRAVAEALVRVREAHQGAPEELSPPSSRREHEPAAERQAGPVAPERFGVLQALLAHLLAACGEGREATIDAHKLADDFNIPFEALEEHLSLLNLVNFGGGCYAVYAELDGDLVHVDKELYGDTFRRPPRLTPLEARAIRLALEFVGPMIAASAHTPLDRVRAKLEETFGQFPLAQPPEQAPSVDETEEDIVSVLSRGASEHRLVEFEYLKDGQVAPSSRLVEPYSLERDLPFWRVHTWDRVSDGPRTFRLDRIKGARLLKETFEPRPDYDPQAFRDAGTARVRYSGGEPARRAVERWGATLLRDGSAVAELKFGSKEWIVGEVLAWRGDAVVIDPPELRRELRDRAKTLAQELGVSRLRVKS